MLVATTLIFLSALNQNNFYLSRPRNVKEAFICFNSTSTCDNWPQNWRRLKFETINNGDLYVMKKTLSPSEVNEKYKLRLIYHDQHYEDTADWRSVTTHPNELNNEILSKLADKIFTYIHQKQNSSLEQCSIKEPVDLLPNLKLHLNSLFVSQSYSINIMLYFIIFFQLCILGLCIFTTVKRAT